MVAFQVDWAQSTINPSPQMLGPSDLPSSLSTAAGDGGNDDEETSHHDGSNAGTRTLFSYSRSDEMGLDDTSATQHLAFILTPQEVHPTSPCVTFEEHGEQVDAPEALEAEVAPTPLNPDEEYAVEEELPIAIAVRSAYLPNEEPENAANRLYFMVLMASLDQKPSRSARRPHLSTRM